MAFLAFIPFANFWLLFTPSKNVVSANRAPMIPLLSGTLGVLIGFVLLVAGVALATFTQVGLDRMVAKAENNPVALRAGVDIMLRSQGIEETLRQLASEVPTGQRIDEVTILLRVTGDGTTLRYLYEVSTNPDALPISMHTNLVQHNCTYEALHAVIEAGATIEHVYQRTNGSEIGVVAVTRDICGH
jgi:hypothetical protein